MFNINFKSVHQVPGKETTFCKSSRGFSRPSTAYMDKNEAPPSQSIAWLQITNLNYTPLDPTQPPGPDNESSDNPYYIIQQWIWIDKVYSPQPPFARIDGNGNPISDPETLDYEVADWTNYDCLVRVEFYEHKRVLNNYTCLFHYNTYNLLAIILDTHNSSTAWPFRSSLMRGKNWEELSNVILHRDYICIDYGTEADRITYDDGEFIPTDLDDAYPPLEPRNLLWQNWPLDQCLDALFTNFLSAGVEYPNVIPDEDTFIASALTFQEYLDTLIVALEPVDPELPEGIKKPLTYIRWKRQGTLQPFTGILFRKMEYPVISVSEQNFIDKGRIIFPSMNTHFSNLVNIYHPLLKCTTNDSNTSFSTYDARYNHVCNYAVYSQNLPIDLTLIEAYLLENLPTKSLNYDFITTALPPTFFLEEEWEFIEFVITDNDYYIHVSKRKAPQFSEVHTYNPGGYNTMDGTIVSVDTENSTIVARYITNAAFDNVIDGEVTIPVSNNLTEEDANKTFKAYIDDGFINIISMGEPDIYTPVLFNGERPTVVTHTILEEGGGALTAASFICADADIEFINNNPIFNYTFDSVELDDDITSFREPFGIKEFNLSSFGGPSYTTLSHYAKVTFRSKATLELILAYLDTLSATYGFKNNEPYKTATANAWLLAFEYINIYLHMSNHISYVGVQATWNKTVYNPTGSVTQTNPFLDMMTFVGPYSHSPPTATTNPATFIRTDDDEFHSTLNLPVPYSYKAIAIELAKMYYVNHACNWQFKVGLVTVPYS